MPDRMRRPSIRDVARLSGVSHQTVSRVLNDSGPVSGPVRERVREAIAELDFHPSSAARAVGSGRGRDFAVLGSSLQKYGWASILAGAQARAQELGFGIALHSLDDSGDATAWLRSQTVRGALVMGVDDLGTRTLTRLPDDAHVVGVGGRPDPARLWVSVAEHAGALAAVEHLLESGPTVHFVSSVSLRHTERERGWHSALSRAGRPVPAVVQIGETAQDAYRAGTRLAGVSDVWGVLCANDEIAIPLMAGLIDGGRVVPRDVRVVGFDDIPLAGYTRPGLTSVRQDFEALGRLAIDVLESGVDGSTASRLIDATLVRRASSGI